MNITGFQKLTLKDYPKHVACIIFTQGCNFKCPYCQNSDLISFENNNLISEEDVLHYLTKRKNMLEGVVITGGEPLLQKDIKTFIKKLKELGLKIKLDTNASNPILLKELLDEDLLNYVAMDIKNDYIDFEKTAGVKNLKMENINESINLLKNSNINHEFRTTIVKEFHKYQNIENICNLIGQDEKYYLQNFEDSQGVLDHELHGFTKEELQGIQEELEKNFPNVKVRGL